MKLLSILLICLALISADPCAYPQTSWDAVKLLEKVSSSYRELRSYKITGLKISEEQRGEYHSLAEMPFTMAAVNPGKFRFESGGPMFNASTLVSDGVKTTQYTGFGRQYMVQPADTATPADLPATFKPPDYVSRYSHLAEKAASAKFLREESLPWEGKNVRCTVVEAVLKADSTEDKNAFPSHTSHTFWVDESTFFVLKESWETPVEDEDGSYAIHTSLVYRVIQSGGVVEDSLFTFVPPKSARQVDQLNLPFNRKPAKTTALTGKEAPEFLAVSTTGEKINLKSLQGRVVLLDFWATWCEPCRASEPLMHRLSEKFKDKGLVVVGINFGEQPEAVKGYIRHNSSPFSIYLDEDQKIAKSYGVNSIPAFILISKEGKVLFIENDFDDKTTESKLEAALKGAGIEP